MTATLAIQLEDNQIVATGLLVVGIVFISAWLLMRLRKRNLRGPGYTTAHEHLERYRQKDAVRDDLESLMVDIEQMAKRLGAQLDAKSIQLERLIDDADLRISQLQHAESPAAVPDPGAGGPEAPGPNNQPADPLAADVYRLADEGLEPPQIAQRLEEHVGKVELILALRSS